MPSPNRIGIGIMPPKRSKYYDNKGQVKATSIVWDHKARGRPTTKQPGGDTVVHSPYFSRHDVISIEDDMEDSDSGDDDGNDWEEVETAEADPFDLIEREQQKEEADSSKSKGSWSQSRGGENKSGGSNHVIDLNDGVSGSDDDEEAFDRHKASLPAEGIKVELEHPVAKKRKKDREEILRQRSNRYKKEMQENLHKAHFVCLVARGVYLNRITLDDTVKGLCYSHMQYFLEAFKMKVRVDQPEEQNNDSHETRNDLGTQPRRSGRRRNPMVVTEVSNISNNTSAIDMNSPSVPFLKEFVRVFREYFALEEKEVVLDELDELTSCLMRRTASSPRQLVLAFIAFLRVFGSYHNLKLQVRLVQAMTPLPIQPKDLILSEKQKNKRKKKASTTSGKRRKSDQDAPIQLSSDDESSDSIPAVVDKMAKKSKFSDMKDDNIFPCDSWSEVYLDSVNKWIPVDPVNQIIDETDKFEVMAAGAFNSGGQTPIHYFLSFDDDGHVKECSARYASKYLTSGFNRPRADWKWVNETLHSFRPEILTQQELNEDEEINQSLANIPLPSSISDFKGHPLVVLKRHILVYEAIYPPDTKPISQFREEPVYSRKCVHPVRSELYWKRQARVLKEGSFPYKVVKGRKKWDRFAEKYITNLPNELYGFWQTDQYEPPVAVDGKVPRNEFGNVELFQPCMLPKGCVHLLQPGLARIAAKLGIDCVPAVTGFGNAQCRVVPVIEGWVVCQEFKDILLDAHRVETMQAVEKSQAKRLMKVYANWRRLTRGLLVRERLKAKYTE